MFVIFGFFWGKIVIYLVGRKCRLHGRFNSFILAVKVDGSDVKSGICEEVFM